MRAKVPTHQGSHLIPARLLVVAVAVLLVVALVLLAWSLQQRQHAASTQVYDIHGVLFVDGGIGPSSSFDDSCMYPQLGQGGIQMLVRDERGRVLGSAPIGPGEDTPRGGCEYRFQLEDIPKAESYRFAQSTGWQDQRVYSFEEMQEMDWKVRFSSFRK
ncbi:MAG: hypothetical protein M3P51_01700 [Chloroflexota bacterium]|nr:hypothetical protein [Chloroflexota bacterium]